MTTETATTDQENAPAEPAGDLSFLSADAEQEETAPVRPLDNSHPDNADTVVMPRQVRERPGRLTTQGTITLQSRQAHRLFYGRRADKAAGQYPIVGLVRFAKLVGDIWNAAADDDPYADMVLLEIETAHEDAARAVADQITAVQALIAEQMEGIDVEIVHSIKPAKLDIQFYSPWAYRAAILLTRFDQLVLLCLTARKVGLMLDDDWDSVVVRCGTRIRHMFELSRRWLATGVTRDDIAANNQVAQRADAKYSEQQQMLVMVDDVVSGKTRAKLAPRIKQLASN